MHLHDVCCGCSDALREGAHRLLKPLAFPNADSPSPLVQPPHQMQDGTPDTPSASPLLPLKVVHFCMASHVIERIGSRCEGCDVFAALQKCV